MIKTSMMKDSIRKFIPEWSLAIALGIYFVFVGNKTHPFLREFLINDPSIQHPFTKIEQINDITCLLISSLIPLICITLIHGVKINFNLQKFNKSKFQSFQLSILGLILTLALTGTITVFLKNLIARPRPDFIDRCKPDLLKIKPNKSLYTIDICTSNDLEFILEGLRSTPSGHSSISFSGMNYLCLIFMAQWKVWSNKSRIYKLLLTILPEFIAIFIALSRTQDYRHHFGDVIMGSLIGLIISWIVYRKFYPSLNDENCEDSYYLQDVEILPLYNRDV